MSASDRETMEAFGLLARTEGILAALESSHAVAHAVKLAAELGPGKALVVNLSGRGDKDIFIIADALGDEEWKRYCREYGEGRIR